MGIVDRAHLRVVGQVGNQEQARDRERRQHHAFVRLAASLPDEHESGDQQHGRRAVQSRVERGQIVKADQSDSLSNRLASAIRLGIASCSEL